VTRTEAIAAVDRAQKTCCGYRGKKCDCKYGASGGSEQTGCPELRELGAMLTRLSDTDWDALQAKAFDEPDDCAHNRVTIDRAQGTETCEDCGAENPLTRQKLRELGFPIAGQPIQSSVEQPKCPPHNFQHGRCVRCFERP
jgi:hypothetical protein